jgi:hypothetical protein
MGRPLILVSPSSSSCPSHYDRQHPPVLWLLEHLGAMSGCVVSWYRDLRSLHVSLVVEQDVLMEKDLEGIGMLAQEMMKEWRGEVCG